MNPYAPPQFAGPPPPTYPQEPDTAQARSRLLIPGIALSVISGILILVFVLDLVLVATGSFKTPVAVGGLAEMMTPGLLVGVCIFAILVNGGILFAMIQMMRLRWWGLALAGCIVAGLPIASSGCCLLTLPFAIWAIVVLSQVKASFR